MLAFSFKLLNIYIIGFHVVGGLSPINFRYEQRNEVLNEAKKNNVDIETQQNIAHHMHGSR
jgi:hypothetical protein